MIPIQLEDPIKGDPYAYACGRCHRVHAGGFHPDGPPTLGLLQKRKVEAERCCTCLRCGKPHGRAGTIGYCGPACTDAAFADDRAATETGEVDRG